MPGARLQDAFDIWPEDALEAMHSAALKVLAAAGVRVDSPQVREVLLGAGCLPGPADRVAHSGPRWSWMRWRPGPPAFRARRPATGRARWPVDPVCRPDLCT